MIAKKIAYMPKARNRSREDRAEAAKQMMASGDFESQPKSYQSSIDSKASSSYDRNDANASTASERTASQLWLKNRRRMQNNSTSFASTKYSSPSSLAESKENSVTSTTTHNTEDTKENQSNNDNKKGNEFLQFMRSNNHFAAKPTRTVRQCTKCQVLYTTGHACSIDNGIDKEKELDALYSRRDIKDAK